MGGISLKFKTEARSAENLNDNERPIMRLLCCLHTYKARLLCCLHAYKARFL